MTKTAGATKEIGIVLYQAYRPPAFTVLRICSASPLALHPINGEIVEQRSALRTGNRRAAAMPDFRPSMTAIRA